MSRLLLPMVIAATLSTPSFVPAQEEEGRDAAREETSSAALPDTGNSELTMRALSLVGYGYKWGGRSPDHGFDCSGFVGYVFERATGMALPRNAAAISRLGDRVERSELQPGDLVFFVIRRKLISHVGMYVGDGRFVHAASRGGDVRVSHLEERYWSRRFAQARRLLSTP